MLRTLRIQRSAEPNTRLLIIRLITSTALALLVFFALTATAHSDLASTETAGLSALSSATNSTASSADSAELADPDQATPLASANDANALVEAAVCVLGVLCGLTAMIVLWRTLRARDLFSAPSSLERFVPTPVALVTRPRVSMVSLALLSVSRT